MRLKTAWGRVPEWGKAFLIAIGLGIGALLALLGWAAFTA